VSRSNSKVPRIWVDTDVALGGPRGDVDDGFALAALLAAHRRGEAEILGVSTVFGNTTAESSEQCVRTLCSSAGVAVALLRGAEERGEATAASDAIAALTPEVELLCLGPLTNVAAACRQDRKLPERLRLRVVGANLSSRGLLPPLWPFEFNFARDRLSARFTLACNWKSATLYPLDVVRRLRLDGERLEELRQCSPMGAYLAQSSIRWLKQTRWRYPLTGFPLWDLVPALDALGALEGLHGQRPLPAAIGSWLGTQKTFRCLLSFDPSIAWRRFLDLIRSFGAAFSASNRSNAG
jgi:inosine-uridine nucleoside N-ribohydrolase